MIDFKECGRCKESKPIDCYSIQKNLVRSEKRSIGEMKIKHDSICKDCHRRISKRHARNRAAMKRALNDHS